MKEIQGLENYSYDEIVDLINDFIIDKIWDNWHSADDIKLNDIRLHGSRLRNQAKSTSDLDAVVEYDGDIREDDFFNILNDDPLYIDDVRVDINPIKEDLDLYMKRSADYDRHKLSLEYRLRKLEQLICEGKKDQEVLRGFLGDDYYDRFQLIKDKIKDPDYKDVYKIIKQDPDDIKSYIDNFKSQRDLRSAAKGSGAKLIYRDDDWSVYRITTYDAAALYGKNTKWCITGRYPGSESEGERYFNDYINDYNLDGGYYFYINRHDPAVKYCVLQDDNNNIHSIWDAADNDLGDKFASVYIRQNVMLPPIDEIPASEIKEVDYDALRMKAAIDDSDCDKVKQLIKDGIDPMIIIEDGVPALMYACVYGADTSVAETLLRCGADPNDGGVKSPPLIFLTRFGDLAGVKVLLEFGANPNLTDHRNHTALYYAVKFDFYECAASLVEYGADASISVDGETVYDIAANDPNAGSLFNAINSEG